ncbi:hypothetical protein ABPG74_022462 [Tetrahymena malaccensis]
MDFNDIAELNKRIPYNKIQQNIQNKLQSFLLNQSQAKEKKVVQVDGHTFLKKSQSKENLDKIQALTNRKKVGNIYEDIEDIVDRAISDDEEQIDRLDNLKQSQDEEKYIEDERMQMKKKIYLAEQEILQKKQEQERFEKLKKEFKDKQLELKCFCKKIGVKIVYQCEFCKELKKIKLIN